MWFGDKVGDKVGLGVGAGFSNVWFGEGGDKVRDKGRRILSISNEMKGIYLVVFSEYFYLNKKYEAKK